MHIRSNSHGCETAHKTFGTRLTLFMGERGLVGGVINACANHTTGRLNHTVAIRKSLSHRHAEYTAKLATIPQLKRSCVYEVECTFGYDELKINILSNNRIS